MSTAPASTTFEAFSLTHAAILNGSTGVEEEFGDFYGVTSGSLALDESSWDNTGDDHILSTWYWANRVNVTVQGGYIPFDTISLLTGSQVASSGSGDSSTYSMPLWEERAMNTKPRPLLIRVPAKDVSGNLRTLDFILYRVQFQPIAFNGPSYKNGMQVNYNGHALFSSYDEKGQPVVDSVTGDPTRAIGRLVNKPLV